jgi:hypothetical protein
MQDVTVLMVCAKVELDGLAKCLIGDASSAFGLRDLSYLSKCMYYRALGLCANSTPPSLLDEKRWCMMLLGK